MAMLTGVLLPASFLLALLATPVAAQDPWSGAKAAFFGVTFLDTSYEGEAQGVRADETARVVMVESQLAAALEEQGLELVPLDPVAAELAHYRNPADCYGCDVRRADALGARYAVTSEVQKVSNLILSMNVVIRDVETGATVRALAVDIRGNTDESWTRGMRYILRNGIFKE
jgi:hypothetical protein